MSQMQPEGQQPQQQQQGQPAQQQQGTGDQQQQPAPQPQQQYGLLQTPPAQAQPQQQGQPQAGMSREEIEQIANSVADKRINQYRQSLIDQGVLNPQGQPVQQQPPAQQPPAPQGQPQQQPYQPPMQQAQPPDRSTDYREARLSARQYLSDSVTFHGADERSMANDLLETETRARIDGGESPESAARAAAHSVASRLGQIRSQYESATVAALTRRGAIDVTKIQQQQPPGQQQSGITPAAQPIGGPAPTTQMQYNAGAERAKQMYADRLAAQQKQGSPPQQQQ